MGAPNPYAELEEIYAKLPKLSCKGLCQESCGPIIVSGLEKRRLENRVGGEVGTVCSRNLCPLLSRNSEKCTVYHIRPLICRLWGAVESMPCKFGCVPEPRYLTHREGLEWLGRVAGISRKAGFPEGLSTVRDAAEIAMKLVRAGAFDG